MRCGSVPASSSRATRSVSTRVLPEPALAETQLEAVGRRRPHLRRRAPRSRLLSGRVAVAPLAAARQMVVVAGVGRAPRPQAGGKARRRVLVVADQGAGSAPRRRRAPPGSASSARDSRPPMPRYSRCATGPAGSPSNPPAAAIAASSWSWRW